MGKIFGIDLGTTYSCIAYVDEYGKPVTVPNQENSPVTPSVVFFESESSVSVGDVAKQALGSDPDLVCTTIKRQMGKRDFVFNANGIDYSPETVSSLILKKLAKDASEKLGEEVKDVVITCPAYFGLDEREATKKAGEIAGFNVLSIINEPTAAAISYGLKTDETQTVMVYDLGGGTFDVTIIKVESGVIEVIATGGDHNLGGKDWDAEIQKFAIDQYVQQTGGSEDDIYDDTVALGDLELKCEQAKKQLSSREKTSFRLNGAKIEISVEQFENNTANLLESSIDKTKDTMKEAAAKGITQYDKILLVGGSSFMPQVKKRLEQEFPGMPIEFADPNESVAKGAAVYGNNISSFIIDDSKKGSNTSPNPKPGPQGTYLPNPIVVKNVVSKSYALQMLDESKVERLFNFIFKNSSIPLEVPVHAFTVVPNQEVVRLSVFENDYAKGASAGDIVNDEDAKLLISDDLKPLPDNLPEGAPIEVILKIDEQGLLSVDAKDVTGGRTVHMEVKLQSVMSAEEEKKAKEQVHSLRMM
jgi:molecular chaperone DnaK (HSP70)